MPVGADRLVEADQGAGAHQCHARPEHRPDELAEAAGTWVVMATSHQPDDCVRVFGNFLVEREVAIDSHDDQGKPVLFLESRECVVHLAEELAMRLIAHGGSIDSLAARQLGSAAWADVNHREGFIGEFGQDVGRRLEESGRLLGQDEDAVPRGPVEGVDEVSRRERGVETARGFTLKGR